MCSRTVWNTYMTSPAVWHLSANSSRLEVQLHCRLYCRSWSASDWREAFKSQPHVVPWVSINDEAAVVSQVAIRQQNMLVNTVIDGNRLKNSDVLVFVRDDFFSETVLHRKLDVISMINLEKAEMNVDAISAVVRQRNFRIVRLQLVLGKVHARCRSCKITSVYIYACTETT